MRSGIPAAVPGRRALIAGLSLLPPGSLLFLRSAAASPSRPLASWKDGPAKQAILDFVRATTEPTSSDFVPPEDRVATFDQDGTLWVEHPFYTQAMFALDRVHELAPHHPEWRSQEPFKDVLANDPAALAHFTEHDWAEIIFLTHSGMSEATFLEIAGGGWRRRSIRCSSITMTPVREYAYGPAGGLPDSKVGTFSQELMDEAKSKAWTVISMKNDWNRIFAFH